MVEKSEKSSIFAAANARELSSVGSEHRPYKAGVVGSSPTVPTTEEENPLDFNGFFFSDISVSTHEAIVTLSRVTHVTIWLFIWMIYTS